MSSVVASESCGEDCMYVVIPVMRGDVGTVRVELERFVRKGTSSVDESLCALC